MESMKQEIRLWSKRNLTPFGKIIVLKSLVVSKIVHILQSLPSPSEKIFKELESLFYNFLWNNGPDKIKRVISTQSKVYGGLDMLDIRLFNMALKISWIGKLFSKTSKWILAIKQICPTMLKILENGPEFIITLRKSNDNDFWDDTLLYFKLFSEKFVINSWQKLMSQSFLFAKNIKID